MIIGDKIEVNAINIQKVEKGKEKASGERSDEVLFKDQVSVSDKAKEIGRLQLEVSKIPDVRADRVDEIKNAMDAGAYNVKGEAVAGKFLQEAVIDSII
jgi:negative regulator of flagellin synthesis FlgM